MEKAYVATKFQEKAEAKEMMFDLAKLNIGITHDWTIYETATADKTDCAILDANGVIESNFIVFIADKELDYAGSYSEMGIAIGAGKPVYLIGHGADENIFVNHPTVKRFETKDDFLKYMRNGRTKVG